MCLLLYVLTFFIYLPQEQIHAPFTFFLSITAVSMTAKDGEQVDFFKPTVCEGQVRLIHLHICCDSGGEVAQQTDGHNENNS